MIGPEAPRPNCRNQELWASCLIGIAVVPHVLDLWEPWDVSPGATRPPTGLGFLAELESTVPRHRTIRPMRKTLAHGWLAAALVFAGGAPAQEPTPALDRLTSEVKRAEALVEQRKLPRARAAAAAAWKIVADHPELRRGPAAQDWLGRLATAARRAEDMHTAHDAYAAVVADRMRRLPDDHLDVQIARRDLGGDEAGAREPGGSPRALHRSCRDTVAHATRRPSRAAEGEGQPGPHQEHSR